jgi:tripartite-type tricarboxylate transporter receptor subunit TctC
LRAVGYLKGVQENNLVISGGLRMRRNRAVVSKVVVSCLLVVLSIPGFATRALSQDYPTKAITMVVGIDAGGMIDVATRTLADEMKKIVKQDVLVENRPGASHLVALSYVLATKPDGYTLFSSTDSPFVRVPHMLKVKFDPIAETVPIIFYGIFTHFVFVPADSPFKTLKDFFTFAKENPGKLTVGNPGFGTGPYVTMAGVALETGLKFSHVPFAGEPKLIAGLLGGHLMSGVIPIDNCLSLYKAGKLRILGVLQGDERLSAFPDVPTLKEVAKEFGMKSSVIYPGLMIAGPKAMPGPIVKKLADSLDMARRSPAFQKYARDSHIYQDRMPITGEALQKYVRAGYQETGDLVRQLGIEKK